MIRLLSPNALTIKSTELPLIGFGDGLPLEYNALNVGPVSLLAQYKNLSAPSLSAPVFIFQDLQGGSSGGTDTSFYRGQGGSIGGLEGLRIPHVGMCMRVAGRKIRVYLFRTIIPLGTNFLVQLTAIPGHLRADTKNYRVDPALTTLFLLPQFATHFAAEPYLPGTIFLDAGLGVLGTVLDPSYNGSQYIPLPQRAAFLDFATAVVKTTVSIRFFGE